MLRSLKDLEEYKVSAVDGDIGRVTDFLFDDQHWTIRYLVTDASGSWERPIQVLISPISFLQVDWATRLFHLGLTKDKIRSSPSVVLSKPISRQYERACSQYYGWPFYWGFGDSRDMAAHPSATSTMKPEEKITAAAHHDPHLRSAKEVAGYHVHGSDGKIGHVVDFIVDDETWTIRYLVIDTSNWWLGNKVLIAPQWAQKINWSESMVYLDLTKDAIVRSPIWKPGAELTRELEESLREYFGTPAP